MKEASTRESGTTRSRVLEAALSVFSQKGYHETTMDEVAKAAQVSKGALYLHFPSKQSLFSALVETASAMLTEEMQRAMAPHQSHRAQLKAAVEAAFALVERYRAVARLVFVRGSSDPLLEHQIYQVHQRMVDLIRARLGEAGVPDAHLVALAWVGAIYEVLVWWLHEESTTSLTALAAPLTRLLLRSIRTEEA